MTDDTVLRDKIEETFHAVEPNDTLPKDGLRQWTKLNAEVDIEVGPDGMGGHLIVDGVEIGNLSQGFVFKSSVNDLNRLTIHLIAMPMKLRAKADVEIIDHQLLPDDDPKVTGK